MAKQKQKFYVVWVGREPGIYGDWDSCKAQVEGFEGARYKSYPTKEEAEQAFISGNAKAVVGQKPLSEHVVYPSLSVDAACSGNPGIMEYRGVDTKSGEVIFHKGPFQNATNNIGEFLALVHGLAYMQKNGYNYPIYSDSRTAQSWVRQRQCKTKLPVTPANEAVFELVRRAEQWLRTHSYTNTIIKWDTDPPGRCRG